MGDTAFERLWPRGGFIKKTPVSSTHAVERFFLCQCVEISITEIYVQFKLYVVSFCTLTQGTPHLLVPMAQSLDLLHVARLHTDFEI
jgi:hypothetical protein